MAFLRLKETRFTSSMVAVIAWGVASLFLANSAQLLLGTYPLFVLLMANLLPMLAMFAPALLAFVALRAGRLPAILCAALSIAIAWLMLGRDVALAVALVLVPVTTFSVYAYETKRPFWLSVGICVGLLLAVGMAIIGAILALCGGDMVTALRAKLEPLIPGMPQLDHTLLWLANLGMVKVPDAVMPSLQLGSAAVLDAPIRDELVKQFLFLSESWLRQSLPNQLVQGAILGGLLCAAWPRWVANRFATTMEIAPILPFHKWFIPLQPFLVMLCMVVGCLLMGIFSGADAFLRLFDMLVTGFGTVLGIQGCALIAFMMRKNGVRPSTRKAGTVALVAALVVTSAMMGALNYLLFLLTSMLALLGIMDELLNPRALRKPHKDKRDEEDYR